MGTYHAEALEALADASRRSIFESLGDGPKSVADIASRVPISRPAVSQHLKVLRSARLVSVRPQGTRRIYSLDPEGLAEVRSYFEQFWSTTLGAFAEAVEQVNEEEP